MTRNPEWTDLSLMHNIEDLLEEPICEKEQSDGDRDTCVYSISKEDKAYMR